MAKTTSISSIDKSINITQERIKKLKEHLDEEAKKLSELQEKRKAIEYSEIVGFVRKHDINLADLKTFLEGEAINVPKNA